MARRRAGLTQERAAEILGISRRTLQRWEAGQIRPPRWVLEAAGAVILRVCPQQTGGRR